MYRIVLATVDGQPEWSIQQVKHGRYETREQAFAEARIRNSPETDSPIPGLTALGEAQSLAYNEETRYHTEFQRMMDDEDNDGARPPEPLNEMYRTYANDLARRFPRAAVYLRAQGYTLSENLHKYSAGKRAMKIITDGGSVDDAKSTLENWLPETAMWD